MKRLNDLLALRWFGVLLFVAFMLLWALLTKVHTHSWQEESRMATVQTLVEQGTFIIDHTEFNRTGDKVFINEHFYSDKTPVLSVAAAGVYACCTTSSASRSIRRSACQMKIQRRAALSRPPARASQPFTG